MALDCDTKGSLLIFFSVYAGLLTGGVVAYIFVRYVCKGRKAKQRQIKNDGVVNQGFSQVHETTVVTSERLRDDLEGQRHYRKEASPLATVVELREDKVDRGVVEAKPNSYLQLTEIPLQDEFSSVKSATSSNTLYDDVMTASPTTSKGQSVKSERMHSITSQDYFDAHELEVVEVLAQDEHDYLELADEQDEEKKKEEEVIKQPPTTTTSAVACYDDVANVVRRKKGPPPPPPKQEKPEKTEDVVALTSVDDIIYEDVTNTKKASTSSSNDDAELRQKEYMVKDREEARRSYQAAPEKYRKESAYLDVAQAAKAQEEEVVKFQRRRSSYSSASEVQMNRNGLNSSTLSSTVSEDSSSDTSDSLHIEQPEIVPPVKDKTILQVVKPEYVIQEKENHHHHSSSYSESEREDDRRPNNPMTRDHRFVDDPRPLPNRRPRLHHELAVENFELEEEEGVVVRANCVPDETDTSDDEERKVVPTRPIKKVKPQREVKSLSLGSSRKTSSSSNSPGTRKTSSSERIVDPLARTFLKNLNKDYEPVYRLRKVNSTTQTEVGRSKSTDQW